MSLIFHVLQSFKNFSSENISVVSLIRAFSRRNVFVFDAYEIRYIVHGGEVFGRDFARRQTNDKEIIMNRLTNLFEYIFQKMGLRGIIPTGNMPPDNTETFDQNRQPEQYAEYVDALSPN
jgi:hypothetical protein